VPQSLPAENESAATSGVGATVMPMKSLSISELVERVASKR
jgi:hypothetical protein